MIEREVGCAYLHISRDRSVEAPEEGHGDEGYDDHEPFRSVDLSRRCLIEGGVVVEVLFVCGFYIFVLHYGIVALIVCREWDGGSRVASKCFDVL